MMPLVSNPKAADLPTLKIHQQGSRGMGSPHTRHWWQGCEEAILRASTVTHVSASAFKTQRKSEWDGARQECQHI